MSLLKITKNALPNLKRVLGKSRYLFFGAKSGGCSGFEYTMKPFDLSARDSDEKINIDGIPFVICGKSMFLVIGTEIDWVEDTMGSRFVFSNPNATGGCGCGATFST